MSQTNTLHTLFVGLDIAKSSLQLHLAGQFHRLSNNAKGHQQLLKLLRDHPCAHIICEASGGYEQCVLQILHAAAVPVSLIEAGRIRHFAKAKGLRAKTDPIDAAVLSDYGRAVQPRPTPPRSALQQRLVQLSTRRQQLIEVRVSERNRAEHYSDPFSQKQSKQLLSLLDKQISGCDEQLLQLIAQDQALHAKAQRLDLIPGVGATTATIVLAQMPELGQLSSQAVAALAGLAPYNRDSGSQTGVRHIHGGRKAVRCALYMSALSAVRYDRIFKAFYLRLRLAGKKPLVALTACMRKLIVLMNHLLKNPNFRLAN
jgi:transposase